MFPGSTLAFAGLRAITRRCGTPKCVMCQHYERAELKKALAPLITRYNTRPSEQLWAQAVLETGKLARSDLTPLRACDCKTCERFRELDRLRIQQERNLLPRVALP